MRRLLSLFLLIALLAALRCRARPARRHAAAQPDGCHQRRQMPPPTPGESGPVTISYAVWDYEQQIYEPLAKKFTAEHPNITVALVSLDDMMNVPQQQQNLSRKAR